MIDELGLMGWLLVALGWTAAGLGVAWLFGSIAQAGKGGPADRRVPSAVKLYNTDRADEQSAAPGAITTSLNDPAKL
jgi:hypothetical protein